MRMLIHLENPVRAFRVTEEQVQRLAARLPGHAITRVEHERELLARLPDADAVVVWNFLAEWYARAPNLRDVYTPAAGRELIAPDPRGRVRLHFGAFHGAIMAESLLAMMLFMKRRLDVAVRAQQQRIWDRQPYETTQPLRGDTALIIGFGAIGRACARLLRPLGVTVHGLRRTPAAVEPDADRMFGPDELLEAVALADHVVCILPGDTGTTGLLSRPAFERMKPTAFVYNLGRGNAIDADALCAALRQGRIQGAFLDVFPEEPLPDTSPLWDVPNLHVTPHASAVRADYLDLYFEELVGKLAALPA